MSSLTRSEWRALAPASIAIAGCQSMSALHTARPLPVGESEVIAGLGAFGFEDSDGAEALPYVDVRLRRGLAERVDAGIGTSTFSTVQLDLNYAFLDRPDLSLSVDPTVSIVPLPGVAVVFLWLPLLADVYRRGDTTVTASAKLGYVSVDEIDADDDLGIQGSGALIGFGLGVKFKVSERLWLLPELDVAFPSDEAGGEPLYVFQLALVDRVP